MQQISTLGILTMCMSLLMISGGLDISIGNMTGLIANSFCQDAYMQGKVFLYVLLYLLILGTVCGFINGLIIAKSKVTPLIITSWNELCFSGYCLNSWRRKTAINKRQFEFLGQAKIGAVVPVAIIIYLVIVAFAFCLKKIYKIRQKA